MSTLMDAALKAEEMFEIDVLEAYAYIECQVCGRVNNRLESGLSMSGNTIHHRCGYCGVSFREELE